MENKKQINGVRYPKVIRSLTDKESEKKDETLPKYLRDWLHMGVPGTICTIDVAPQSRCKSLEQEEEDVRPLRPQSPGSPGRARYAKKKVSTQPEKKERNPSAAHPPHHRRILYRNRDPR